jgi:hypothetical protein
MNARLLGMLCIIGSLVGIAEGVRMVLIGTTHEGTFRDPDTLNYLAQMIWLSGSLCAMLGLIALRATGANPIFRLLSYLPVAGYAVGVIGAALGLAGVPVRENPSLTVGQFLSMAGLLVVAILVLAARVWRGWRAFTPLLNIITIPLGAVAYSLTGNLDGAWWIVNAAASALLGYAVMSYAMAPQVRNDFALAAST